MCVFYLAFLQYLKSYLKSKQVTLFMEKFLLKCQFGFLERL